MLKQSFPVPARVLTVLATVLALLVISLPPAVQPALAQDAAPPEITSVGPFTVNEGITAVATLAAAGAGDLVWSKTGGADADRFTLSSTAGVLALAVAGDYEQPSDANGDGTYEITVAVSDGVNTDTADLLVTLENVIELTAITGPAAVTFVENDAARVATLSASSAADRSGIIWSLAGDDGEHFSIDSPPGALRFHIDPVSPNIFPELPDFEAPTDENSDNSYDVTLLAQAGGVFSSPFTMTVTVTDVDEYGSVSFVSCAAPCGCRADGSLA